VQPEDPDIDAYKPAGQFVHDVDPVIEKEPDSQLRHDQNVVAPAEYHT
jgi:hypothetical protein